MLDSLTQRGTVRINLLSGNQKEAMRAAITDIYKSGERYLYPNEVINRANPIIYGFEKINETKRIPI